MNTTPTPKTVRVTVPVTPEVLAKFQRFSDLSGLSVGKAMGDWLADTADGLEALAEVIRGHKAVTSEAIGKLNEFASTMHADRVIKNMRKAPGARSESAASPAHQVASKRGKSATSPRLVIRGVKSSDKGQQGGEAA